MKKAILEADRAALDAYDRACSHGAEHRVALNIAVSMWFCRCPHVDSRLARARVSRLLETQVAAAWTRASKGKDPTCLRGDRPANAQEQQ